MKFDSFMESAVSVDAEADIYNYCKNAAITLFTVSHRSSLWKFHEYLLRFDGRGSYEFKKLQLDDYPKE
jgi:ATP-binding cassette subfamily D (ALD) protein 3